MISVYLILTHKLITTLNVTEDAFWTRHLPNTSNVVRARLDIWLACHGPHSFECHSWCAIRRAWWKVVNVVNARPVYQGYQVSLPWISKLVSPSLGIEDDQLALIVLLVRRHVDHVVGIAPLQGGGNSETPRSKGLNGPFTASLGLQLYALDKSQTGLWLYLTSYARGRPLCFMTVVKLKALWVVK